jgi:hypothetical protein
LAGPQKGEQAWALAFLSGVFWGLVVSAIVVTAVSLSRTVAAATGRGGAAAPR